MTKYSQTHFYFTVAAFLLSSIGTPAAPAEDSGHNVEWRNHSGNKGATKYSSLDQINKSNVRDLGIAWRWSSIDNELKENDSELRASNVYQATPLMVGGVLYTSTNLGLVAAIHPKTGETLWAYNPLDDGAEALRGGANRGLGYWSDNNDERLFVVSDESLIAVNAQTGRSYSGFGDGGKVDLKKGLGPLMTRYRWTSAPLVCRDAVIVGSSMSDGPLKKEAAPGHVRGYDVRTGEMRWIFHVIPQEGEFGTDTWENESWRYTGNTNVWSLMSADEELGYVYLPLTTPTNDWYGGHRLGGNLFAESIVCVNVETGERVWHFQTVHHGLWDYDLPAAPILCDITVGGKAIKAAVQLTKQAFAFVFDRVTGEPVWPIEERPVPQSNVPGEMTSPTQPFPTKPPPFDRQGVTVDDLIDFTPQLRAEAIEIIQDFVYGPLFTPPSVARDEPGRTKGTLQMPGWGGGADWAGGAFDPETHILYVPSITSPIVVALMKPDAGRSNFNYIRGKTRSVPRPQGLPIFKPPYGRITAIDLDTGRHKWMVPNGEGPRDHPALKGLDLPPLGQTGRASPLLTKSLLFLGEGTDEMLGALPLAGGNKFRAYDKTNGEVLWETEFPIGTTGAPMTYRFEGVQYIVVAIGGREHPPELIALSLRQELRTESQPGTAALQ